MLEQQQAVHHRKTTEVHVDENTVGEEILTEQEVELVVPPSTLLPDTPQQVLLDTTMDETDEKIRRPYRKVVFAGWWQ